MTGYEAICFDLDSTLCESTQDGATLLETAFDRAGVDPFCDRADLRAAVPALPAADSDREFFELLFAEVADRNGGDLTLAPDLADGWLAANDPAAVEFRPGAETALELARDIGSVGLITNGGRETQTKKLDALGIVDAFDVTVFTDPTSGVHPKPDAAPFERALGALSVDPIDAVHVGDSLHADVAGANAMGMDSAWLDLGHEAPGDHRPTYELPSLEAFETIVS